MLDRWRRLTSAQQGFFVWLVLVLAWFAYWLLASSDGTGGGATYADVDTETADEALAHLRPWIIWIGAALLSAVFMGGWALIHLIRDRGVKFSDLDPEEQRRREAAGQLLHDL